MTQKTSELQDIQAMLASLQSRLNELDEPDGVLPSSDEKNSKIPSKTTEPEIQVNNPVIPNKTPVIKPVAHIAPQATPVPRAQLRNSVGLDTMSILRAGMAELTSLSKLKSFPDYFVKLAGQTGIRLLLMKRWNTGLQVFLEKNIKMPTEARHKRKDGRAPIPVAKNDIFAAVGQEAAVYSGPVPVKHFPLDLTLMLGRGSRDRQIVILPLPSQNHWNTFLYMDTDSANGQALEIAELLANYALVRMRLLNKGVSHRGGSVSTILKAELFRRQQLEKKRAPKQKSGLGSKSDPQESKLSWPDAGNSESQEDGIKFVTPVNEDNLPATFPTSASQEQSSEIDPFVQMNPSEQQPPMAEVDPKPASDDLDNSAAQLPECNFSQMGGRLEPTAILHHSGELPALPKAACHIMAVIEDPKTTATRLEKALAMDQTLTAKVLRIANSPFYGAVREIRTVSEAIVRLGFITIRNWTLVTAAKSVFLAPGAGNLYQKIWRQSVLSAMAGQLVAQTVGRVEPEGVFIGGLMQNIGQLVLARSHPELFQEILTESASKQVPYHEIERSKLGFDHGELGALLIKEWNLSRELEDAVRWHHRLDEDGATNKRMAAMIALGEEIAWCSFSDDSLEEKEIMPDEEVSESTGSLLDELPPLSSAAEYLSVTHSKMAELKESAKQLHIDPHFFN